MRTDQAETMLPCSPVELKLLMRLDPWVWWSTGLLLLLIVVLR